MKHGRKIHKIPKPMNTPAAIGTIQWIEAINPVHANLLILLASNPKQNPDPTHQKIPIVNTGAPIIVGSKRHSGTGTLLFIDNILI